jgi:hypothetical protein
MCDPASVTLALTVASNVAGVSAQQEQAKAQEQYNQQVYNNQMQAYRYNLANQETQRVAARGDAAEKVNQNAMALAAAKSRARTAAGESGVSGLSVNALLSEMEGQYGMDSSNTYTNLLRTEQSINAGQTNTWAGTSSTINQLKTPTSPNYFGAGLQIAGAGLNYYDKTRKN